MMENSENKFILSFFIDEKNEVECFMYIPEEINRNFEGVISQLLRLVSSGECSDQIKIAMQRYVLSKPSRIPECMRILSLWSDSDDTQKPAIMPRDTLKPRASNAKTR